MAPRRDPYEGYDSEQMGTAPSTNPSATQSSNAGPSAPFDFTPQEVQASKAAEDTWAPYRKTWVEGAQNIGKDTYWGDYYRNKRPAQQVALDTSAADAYRKRQGEIIQQLQAVASGSRNTEAQKMLQNEYGRALAQQQSLGSTFRSRGRAGARTAQQVGAEVQRGYEGDAMMLQEQERLASMNALQQLYAQQHGLDLAQAEAQAQAAFQNMSLEDAMSKFYTQAGLDYALGNAENMQAYNRALAGYELESRALAGQQAQRINQAAQEGWGTALEAYRRTKEQPAPEYMQKQADADKKAMGG